MWLVAKWHLNQLDEGSSPRGFVFCCIAQVGFIYIKLSVPFSFEFC